MWKVISLLLIISLSSFNIKFDDKYTYAFKIIESEKGRYKARFQLTENIDLKNFKKEDIEGLISMLKLDTSKRYYQVMFDNRFSLDVFRSLLISYGVDYELSSILVLDKSFYNSTH